MKTDNQEYQVSKVQRHHNFRAMIATAVYMCKSDTRNSFTGLDIIRTRAYKAQRFSILHKYVIACQFNAVCGENLNS